MPERTADLPTLDLTVVAVYILGIVALGAWFYRKSGTLEGFTVGSRSLPGWAIGLSILATYLSSISFLALPGKSYGGNWNAFVFSLTIPIACWVSARYFIPLYRDKLQTTAYEHLEYRFGYWARAYCGTALILLQIGRIAVVLYLVSLAMQELLGWDIATVIVVLGALTILYTVVGGIEAVIWTDVVQAIVLLGGGLACAGLLIARMPDGAGVALETAWEQEKLSFGGWNFSLALEGFWVVFIFGIVDNLRNFGVDQNFVQRFLAARSDAEARKSLWLGGLLYLPVSALFFGIGTLLFLYYSTLTPTPEGFPEQADKVFPFFIVSELPPGFTGLVIAAVMAAGMSTLDSSINVSATVWVVDFYKRLIRPQADDHQLLRMTRWTSVIVGTLGTVAGLAMIQAKTVLDTWWTFSSIFGGAMLGLFLVGLIIRRATSRGAALGAVAGILVVVWGTMGQDLSGNVDWLRYEFHEFMIGPLATFAILAVAWVDSLLVRAGLMKDERLRMMQLRFLVALFTVIAFGSSALFGESIADGNTGFRLATFSADVTIPLGHRCMGVLPVKATHVVDPLEVHGFVLFGAGQPIVFAAIDWCEIRNDAYDAWRNALAEVAETTIERVLVTSLHQHDAPVVDLAAQRILDEVGLEGELCDAEFHAQCIERVVGAVRESLPHAKPVTHFGIGKAKVERIASNRRIRHLDGSVSYGRGSSSGGDPYMASESEGLIDPWLRTLTFFDGERPIAALSSYAVHPMSYYGRGAVSADFVGAARRQRQRETEGVLQIYASGCSGDTTAGKYNGGEADNRARLAERLLDAMRRASQATKRWPLKQLGFRNTRLLLDDRDDAGHTPRELRSTLLNSDADVKERILAAMALSSRQRVDREIPIDMPCLDFGAAQLVLMPAESFVGYQIMAQQMRPESEVICIGYGECWPGYIPSQRACDDKFDNTWMWVSCTAVPKMRAAIETVLNPTIDASLASGEWGRIELSPQRREKCLAILRAGLVADAFWPSIHAAEGLTAAGQGEEVQAILEPKLSTEHDPQHRCGLARELVRSGKRQYRAVLLEILASEDPTGHVHAAESLYKVGEVGSGRALRKAFESSAENPPLKIMAAAALARAGSPKAMEYLRGEALGNPDAASRKLAAWVLGRIGKDSDIPLIKLQRDRALEAAERAYFDHALAALGDTAGRESLTANLNSADPSIRVYAAKFAGDARVTSVAGRLLELLEDDDLDVRIRAAEALMVLAAELPADRQEDVRRLVFPASEQYPRLTEGSIVERNDGSLLFAVTRFEQQASDFAPARIVGRVSEDGGRTWGPIRLLQDNSGGMNVMSATLRRLRRPTAIDRPLGLFYLQKNGFDDLDVYLRVSLDDGAELRRADPGHGRGRLSRHEQRSRFSIVDRAVAGAGRIDQRRGEGESLCFLLLPLRRRGANVASRAGECRSAAAGCDGAGCDRAGRRPCADDCSHTARCDRGEYFHRWRRHVG